MDAARPSQRAVGDQWFVDETHVKVAEVWRYVYRAVDQHGLVIDVFVSRRRDIAAARRFFTMSLSAHRAPAEVITDRAPALAKMVEELIPAFDDLTSDPASAALVQLLRDISIHYFPGLEATNRRQGLAGPGFRETSPLGGRPG